MKAQQLLNKLVVLKLNGGLGTTMGCKGPKSVIEVREDSTFLDLTVRQIEWLNDEYQVNIPLVLMNSFNTDKASESIVKKYQHHNVTVLMFNQKKFPRIFKDTLVPLCKSADPAKPEYDKEAWYPPGHGDVFDSFYHSKLYNDLKQQGKEYIFICNIDNLGATVDLDILHFLMQNNIEFCMEVTKKTRADVKGGTLIDYEGKVKLLEIAQVPKDKVDEFKSIKKFKIFNTNNLWVHLPSIETHLDKLNELDIIINQKMVGGKGVIQLETACGAAIQHFQRALGIVVPRSRFLPVKSCSDLFVVQSNLYSLQHGNLVMNPKRIEKAGEESVPVVNLGAHYQKVDEYMQRLGGIPDILELDHLTVTGDVTFGSNVTLRGTVIIVANYGDRIDIPSGAVLENKVITGNLRILDH
eukprot:GEZU01033063.1.p1 GENE.GEZU01033063.1~~GEZU01033063.1.p1  ORF type:complete len:411 (+),score=172.74 GEZU01033063.1:302-1534(+)